MMVELELFDFDMDKAVLIGPAPLAARFAEEMRQTHSNFGILADLSHDGERDGQFVIGEADLFQIAGPVGLETGDIVRTLKK